MVQFDSTQGGRMAHNTRCPHSRGRPRRRVSDGEGLPARATASNQRRLGRPRHHRGSDRGRPGERRRRRHRLRLLAAYHVLRAGERVRERFPGGLREHAQAPRAERDLLRARRLGPSHREHLRRRHGLRQRALALHGDAARDGRRVDSGARRRALPRHLAAGSLPRARPRARPPLDRPGRRDVAAKESGGRGPLWDMDARARALQELYEDRYVAFRNALATVTGSRESARDAVQEAFTRAFAQRQRYRGEAPLAAWVWKIAFRAALEGRRRPLALPLEDSVEPTLLEPERDPELAAALQRLSPRRRLIVFLRYFGDFSYAEIAAACEVSEGTIAATLAQAHAELRAALTPEEAIR